VAVLHFDNGSVVREGDPLMELDAALLRLNVQHSEASLAAAQADLARLQAGSRQQEIDMARARVAAREADLESARVDYESQRSLRQEGVVSPTEFTAIESKYQAAQADLEEAQADLRLTLAGSRDEEIAAAQAKAAEAEADLALSRENLARAVVRAPFDAAVARKMTEVGEWVRQGDPVAELLEISPLEVVVDVPERQLPLVSRDQSAEISVDALPGEVFEGQVSAVVPEADLSNRTYPVHVRVENPAGRLRPGMFSRVALMTENPVPTLVMPADALVDRGRGPEVWMVTQGLDNPTAQAVQVTVGRRRGTDIEVLSGLAASDEVVVVGNEMLYPGAALTRGGGPPMQMGAMAAGGPPAGGAPGGDHPAGDPASAQGNGPPAQPGQSSSPASEAEPGR
jgi:multidrug efflux pump subunit AcrA (membrane-fusion protein)